MVALAFKSNTASTATQFSVSATVLPRMSLRLSAAPEAITVTEQDIRRGYIESGTPLHVLINGNAPSGFALDFAPVSALFSGAAVRGLGQAVVFGGEGGTVVQRWGRPAPVDLALTFRFVLTPGVTPGRYAFPLQISARPL